MDWSSMTKTQRLQPAVPTAHIPLDCPGSNSSSRHRHEWIRPTLSYLYVAIIKHVATYIMISNYIVGLYIMLWYYGIVIIVLYHYIAILLHDYIIVVLYYCIIIPLQYIIMFWYCHIIHIVILSYFNLIIIISYLIIITTIIVIIIIIIIVIIVILIIIYLYYMCIVMHYCIYILLYILRYLLFIYHLSSNLSIVVHCVSSWDQGFAFQQSLANETYFDWLTEWQSEISSFN